MTALPPDHPIYRDPAWALADALIVNDDAYEVLARLRALGWTLARVAGTDPVPEPDVPTVHLP